MMDIEYVEWSGYYSAIRKNEIMTSAEMWVDLVSQRKTDVI